MKKKGRGSQVTNPTLHLLTSLTNFVESTKSSLEAQLITYQETLDDKDELKRLCDQYLSIIQDLNKKINDKDTDIAKLKTHIEAEQANFLEFSEKYEIEGLTSEKLTKHLKDNLSEVAEILSYFIEE